MHGRQQTVLERAEQHNSDYSHPSADVSGMVWLADWRALKLPYCSVYIIAPIDGWPCKIGISTNPMKRVNTLQTSVWKQLEVKWCGYLTTVHDARKLESRSHRVLSDLAKWLHGEWFDLRPDRAADLVEFEAMMGGLDVQTKLPPGTATDYVVNLHRARFHSRQAQMDRLQRYSDTSILKWTSDPPADFG